MKVLYIADTYEVGGAFLSFLGMIDAITEMYNDVIPVILTSKYGKINEFANDHSIENYCVGHKAFLVNKGSTVPRRIVRFLLRPLLKIEYEISDINAIKQAEKYVDFSTIDLIHSNSDRNDLGAILARRHNIPHIWHIREFGDWDYQCFSLRKRYIELMNDPCNHFIAISRAVAARWIEKGLNPESVSVIYNGVNRKDTYLIKKEKKGQVKGVIAGFIAPFKGQFDLIKAISLLDDNCKKKISLDIYGNGALEYLLILKAYTFVHGLNKNICFKGYAKDINERYGEYDIGFMCSRAEGFGRVTVEYMLNGLCVIASDTGANKELIDDGVDGYIYRYKDNTDLAAKIEYVVKNRNVAANCARNGATKALNTFTKEHNAKNVYEQYCNVLNAENV